MKNRQNLNDINKDGSTPEVEWTPKKLKVNAVATYVSSVSISFLVVTIASHVCIDVRV